MSWLVESVSFAGYVFLLLTARSSLVATWRLRDANHLNVLLVVGALVATAVIKGRAGSALWSFHLVLVLIQPYLAVRLVQQFWDVPAIVERGSIATVVAGAIALVGWPKGRPQIINVALPLAISLVQAYVAVAFWRESRRSKGVTAK